MRVFISDQFETEYKAEPITLLDIGASGGLQPHWKTARPYLQVIGFEPDDREFGNLSKNAPPGTLYFNTALADKPGPITFHLCRKQMTSSVFEPNRELLCRYPDVQDFDEVATVEVSADTLDNVLGSNKITNVDFAKIDTQGAELGILQGGAGALQTSLFGLEIEVEFIPIYKGQPLFAEVEQYVRAKGFELFDLRPFYWKREVGRDLGGPYGQIAFGDALFFKSGQALADMLAMLPDDEARRRKTLRAISISLLYGYIDYAIELFDSQQGLFSQAQRESFFTETQKSRRNINRLPDFRGRWRASNLLQRASESLDPSNAGWSIGRERLGNG